MFRSTLIQRAAFLASAASLAPLVAPGAQQSDLSVSPFVTFLPISGASPLAGLALTMGGNSGLALRASGHLSLENTNNTGFTPSGIRPWGGDADAVLFLGGRSAGGFERTLAPYVFAGIGAAGRDSLGARVVRNNWSYGAGITLPLGRSIDIFGESRWRMSRYVLPTAQMAPTPTQEFRVGLSFHVGGYSNARSRSGVRPGVRRADASTSGSVSSYPASTATSAGAARLINSAEQYLGARYVYGGTTPAGFDCSGFTQYVFGRQGVRLPRTSQEQAQVGMPLPAEWRAISPGDLVMFADKELISHVAIYAGRNRIIHSSSSGGGVRYDDLSTQRGDWFVNHMVAARRVTTDPHGLLLDLTKGFSEIGIQLDGPDHAPRPMK